MKVRPENLNAYLDSKRGSQAKIARELGIGTSTISQWRSGERPVPVEHIPVICKILGKTPADLCDSFLPETKKAKHDPIVEGILGFVLNMTPERRAAELERYAKEFASEQMKERS